MYKYALMVGRNDAAVLVDADDDKTVKAYIAKGYTLVTDQRRGMNCDDFFVPGKMGKGWCPICQRCVQAMDTLEYYCTMGH